VSSRLSFNSMTADRWPLAEVIDACAEHGIEWIGPWRHRLAELGVQEARRRIDAAGLKVSSLCRGGFFGAADAEEDNRRAVEEAAALGTDALVLVCGPPATKDLARARERIERGIETLLPYAGQQPCAVSNGDGYPESLFESLDGRQLSGDDVIATNVDRRTRVMTQQRIQTRAR